MTRRALRLLAGAALAAAVGSAAAGCQFQGIYSLPLPGAVANGGHTYTVGVQFADVLDLVPYSAVKVDYATVGHVRSVRVQGDHALVECVLLDKVHLPANAVARVEQTSLLGEKFVEIDPPPGVAPLGQLRGGDVIPLYRTDTDATVEEVLASLSMLVNGGGVGQLHTIAHELDNALTGREAAARQVLVRLNTFVGALNVQRGQIVQTIAALDRLARDVRSQEGTLTTAITTMPAALGILADDRSRLTRLLTAVQHLGSVAVPVLNSSRADLVRNLRNLQPTLDRLASIGTVIPRTLGGIFTYPTVDSVEKEYFGDYGNLTVTVDLSTTDLTKAFGLTGPVKLPGSTGGGGSGGGGSGGGLPLPVPTPSLPPVPSVPSVPLPTVSPPTLGPLQLPGGLPLASARWTTGTGIDGLLLGALR